MALKSKLAYSFPKNDARVGRHDAIIGSLTTMSLHTMSVVESRLVTFTATDATPMAPCFPLGLCCL
jgi:hypothetical protein